MPDKPPIETTIVSREQVIKVCEVLGIDENQTSSIRIEADEISLVLFDFNENGERYFVNRGTHEEQYAKYRATLKVV